MAAYPTGGLATSNPDLDLYRLGASNSLDENYGGLRLDYRFNDKYSLTARYFRDQGEASAPLNVTGNYQHITAVPQNGLVSFQQILRPTLINETKIGFNGSKTRLNGVAPRSTGLSCRRCPLTSPVRRPSPASAARASAAAPPGWAA